MSILCHVKINLATSALLKTYAKLILKNVKIYRFKVLKQSSAQIITLIHKLLR